jgi:hypothetical protein
MLVNNTARISGVSGLNQLGEPAGILPAEPDREPQNDRLDQAVERKMRQQLVAGLCDGKHIDEVEKQFLVGDTGMVPVTPP